MLRVHQQRSADVAKSYYTEGLAREDYYLDGSAGHEVVHQWSGTAAARLGLDGPVTKAAFHALVDNVHPVTGAQLTARTKSNRTVGYDFTFDVPKSVSVVHALTRDQRIHDAFIESVQWTMREVERDMQARVRKDGQDHNRTTGNMVWSPFVHLTSRPARATKLPDPQLHCHCFVMNMTFDEIEGQWKAGQFRNLKRDAPYYQAVFDARLAMHLRTFGYGIERDRTHWQIAGIDRSIIRTFSNRTDEIEKLAKELDIHDPGRKAALGARSRLRKQDTLSPDDLRQSWNERLSDAQRHRVHHARHFEGPHRQVTLEEARDHAIQHCLERRSTIDERSFHAAVLQYGTGSLVAADLEPLTSDPMLIRREIDGRTLITTPQILTEEREMVQYAAEGRGTQRPFVAAPDEFRVDGLSDEQQLAGRRLLGSVDRVSVLRGGAGVGKTTLMKEVTDRIESTGARVFAFAPTARASRVALREADFDDADTIQQFLKDPDRQELARDQVIWIDEAGLIGSRTLNKVFRATKRLNARVILTGDTRQHAPVERGDALRLLEDRAGLKPAELTSIVRQRGRYRDAVADMAEGRIIRGFEKLDRLGAIIEHDGPERYDRLVRDYVDVASRGEKALVVAPTHVEGERVNAQLRAALKDAGIIGKDERTITRYRDLSMTHAERQDARSYEPGHVLHFHQNAKGWRRGEMARVKGRDEAGRLLLENTAGRVRPMSLEPGTAQRFQVYAEDTMPVAVGDRIRITKNTYLDRLRLSNGMSYTVTGFTREGHLRLDTGHAIPSTIGHIAPGLCSTSYAAQGRSIPHIFIAQSTMSFPASSAQQFYVSTSRGIRTCRIYTDDKVQLRDHIKQFEQRLSAMELMRDGAEITDVKDPKKARTRDVRQRAQQRGQYRDHLNGTPGKGKPGKSKQHPPRRRRGPNRGMDREPEL